MLLKVSLFIGFLAPFSFYKVMHCRVVHIICCVRTLLYLRNDLLSPKVLEGFWKKPYRILRRQIIDKEIIIVIVSKARSLNFPSWRSNFFLNYRLPTLYIRMADWWFWTCNRLIVKSLDTFISYCTFKRIFVWKSHIAEVFMLWKL